MLLEQHLLQLFGNLPFLPKAEITKHLEDVDLIKALVVSENWDESIKCRRESGKWRKYFSMISKQNRVELTFSSFCYEEMRKIFIDFPVESVLKKSTEIVEYENRLICHSENFKDFENRILTIFRKIRLWFGVDTRHIGVNLDFGFNLEFLKKLHLKKFGEFRLSGDKKNYQIDSRELTDLMENWEIEGSVEIKIETIGKFEGNLKMLRRGSICEFHDSRWITGDMFRYKFDSMKAKFKKCLLTSEDFNVFFKRWMDKKKNEIHVLECYLEHELDTEKVLEGLETKKWNPKKRGRIFRDVGIETDTFTDLADGLDIYRSRRIIGTIHISADKKIIKFFCWFERFPLLNDKKHVIKMASICGFKLGQLVWSEKRRVELTKDLEKYRRQLQIFNFQMAR